MIEFLGRFHPLWVHLPIGGLLLAAVFYILHLRQPEAGWRKSLMLAIGFGTVAALFSSISGYLLSLSGEYDETLTGRHQNAGLITTALALAWLYAVISKARNYLQHLAALAAIGGIFLTGHLGGSLTHGEEYLTGALSAGADAASKRKPVENIPEAKVYADMVEPLLKEKCYSCHSAAKQKGKLRLDEPQFLLKGGEEGLAVVAGKPDESEMIKRIQLPLAHKDHMPPKEKAQLSREEMAVLHWWIQSGLSFDKKVKELNPDAAQLQVLKAFSQPASGTAAVEEESLLPEKEAPVADPKALAALKERGVMVVPVARNSNYLLVDFVTVEKLTVKDIELLKPIQEQVYALNLSRQPVGNDVLPALAGCRNLTRLQLQGTGITNEGMANLAGLSSLQYLNLSGTTVNWEGVKKLAALKKLKNLYLYQTAIGKVEAASIRTTFPKTIVDTGGYQVPTLASDTQLVEKK